tara:strand:- start:4034 stop:4747 length:714 start_codon:yes stop_codon:yes gene_type:complete
MMVTTEPKKKRGRPKGSKNRPKELVNDPPKKKRGRPKGSKNKPKTDAVKTTTRTPKTNRGKQCLLDGQNAEELFEKLAVEEGWELVRKATQDEDMNDHWDHMYKMPDGKEVTVDIKNMKQRRKKWTTKLLVEFRSVLRRGANKSCSGWLYGKADYIAFRIFDHKMSTFDCFLVIDREKLLGHATVMVAGGMVDIETRKGRFDKFSYLPIGHILDKGYVEHVFGDSEYVFPKIKALGE